MSTSSSNGVSFNMKNNEIIPIEKINNDNLIISRETKEHSIFYQPIQNSSKLIYPKLEGWYTGLKSEIKSEG